MTTSQPPARRKRGAPPGNLNALKHGGTSPAMKELARQILRHPGLANRADAEDFAQKRLGALMRDELRAHKQAKERARRIMEPYTKARIADRLVYRLLLALLRETGEIP